MLVLDGEADGFEVVVQHNAATCYRERYSRVRSVVVDDRWRLSIVSISRRVCASFWMERGLLVCCRRSACA